jgi:hypothetical protein
MKKYILYDLTSIHLAQNAFQTVPSSCGAGFKSSSFIVSLLDTLQNKCPESYKYLIKKTDLSLYDFSNDIIVNCVDSPKFIHFDFAKNPSLTIYNREYIPAIKKQRKEMIKTDSLDYGSEYGFPLEIKFKKEFHWVSKDGGTYIFKKGDILSLNYYKRTYLFEPTWLESFMGDDPKIPIDIPIEILFPNISFLQKNNLFDLLD